MLGVNNADSGFRLNSLRPNKLDACHVSGPDTAEPSMKSTAWMTDDTAWMKPANEKLWEHDAPKAVGARQ